ncbi:MAG: polyprenyl synthetase family protein, partial [Planctomycetota bacterium]
MARAEGPRSATPPRDLPAVLAPVGDDLEKVGAAFQRILRDVSWRTRDMVDQAARFSGKRLRPALTCVAARVSGGEVTEDVATVAAIVELIHTATLIHDDVLDGADVRRKVATLNARWGDDFAVLVGDVLFSRAYLAASRLEDRFASQYLSEVVGEVLEGEIHQDLVCRNAEIREEEYREIIRGKTAALYEGAMVVGAHYGGATRHEDRLGRYGHH